MGNTDFSAGGCDVVAGVMMAHTPAAGAWTVTKFKTTNRFLPLRARLGCYSSPPTRSPALPASPVPHRHGSRHAMHDHPSLHGDVLLTPCDSDPIPGPDCPQSRKISPTPPELGILS